MIRMIRRTLFGMTALVAILLFLVRLITPDNTNWLLNWHHQFAHHGVRKSVGAIIGFATICWWMTIPLATVYLSSRPIQFHSPLISRYCFLGSVTFLLTLVVLVIATNWFWPCQYVPLAVILMNISAFGFQVEAVAHPQRSGLNREAKLAIVMGVLSYLALLWLADAMAAMGM